ncbi:MAG: hypothetical protein ACPGSM_15355 [Thiolinea sp.]
MLKTCFLSGLLSFVLILSQTAHATLLVNGELTHEYQTTSGQYLNGLLEVHNAGPYPKHLRISQGDLHPNGHSYSHDRSNRSWVQLSENQVLLQPGATKHIAYNVSVPQGLGSGTYWSTINIEPLKADPHTQQTQQHGTVSFRVKQRLRYTINIMTHLGRGDSRISFQAPQIMHNNHGMKSLRLGLVNNGQFHSRPEVSAEVFDMQGNTLGTLSGNKRGLYPAANKQFEIPLQNLSPGQYRALILAKDTKNGRVFGADMNLTIHP